MNRLLLGSIALLSLTACYDFEGDAGRLGFQSNLRLDGLMTWTPKAPVASGTRVAIAASQRLEPGHERNDDSDTPDVRGEVDGDVIVSPADQPAGVVLQGFGRTSALVTYVGEAKDWFTVRFSPVARARVSAEPALLDRDLADSRLAIVPGATVALCPSLADRRGRSLGYDADDLTIEATGPLSAWMDEGFVHLSADGADGETGHVALAWRGRTVWEQDVRIVDPSAVDELTLTAYEVPNDKGEPYPVAVVAAWIDDSTRLLGAPIEITGSDEVDRDADWPTLVSAKGEPHAIEIHAALGDEVASIELQ